MTGSATVALDHLLPPSPLPDLVLEAELGRGGSGTVYRGRQTFLDRLVAVKLLHREAFGVEADPQARFVREARILASLQHPHIVTCHQAGITPDGQPYLVMELVDGPDLATWIRQNGPLDPHLALGVIIDLAHGLGHALSKGVIHRDVKTENVLLCRRADAQPADPFPWTAKIADLGLARSAAAVPGQHLTQQGVVLGTPSSMAPEQFDHPDGVDHRADIYGLGCILCHLVEGQHPFAGETLTEILFRKFQEDPRTVTRALPGGVPMRRLAAAMLARDRAQRPAGYTEIIERCRGIAAVAAAPARQRRVWIAAAACAVIAAGAVWGLAQSANAQPPPVAPIVAPQPVIAAPPVPLPPEPVRELRWGEAQELLAGIHRGLPGWIGRNAQHAPFEDAEALVLRRGWIEHVLPALPVRGQAQVRRVPGLSMDTTVLGVCCADGTVAGLIIQDLDGQCLLQMAVLDDAGSHVRTSGSPQVVPTPARWEPQIIITAQDITARVVDLDLPPLTLSAAPLRLALGHQPAEIGSRGAVLIESCAVAGAEH